MQAASTKKDSRKPGFGGMTVAGSGKNRFPDYGWAYFNYLLAKCQALSPPQTEREEFIHQQIDDRLKAIEARAQSDLCWNDLAVLERWLIELEPEAYVRREVWNVREQYRAIVGAEEYANYALSGPPDPSTSSTVNLRADLACLLGRIHLHYDLRTQSERLRSHLTRWAAFWAVVVFLVGMALIFWDYRTTPDAFVSTLRHAHLSGPIANPPELPADLAISQRKYATRAPLLAFCIMMGALGGFISLMRRMQASDPRICAGVTRLIQLEHGRHTVILAPVTGAIFAVILFLMFAGGVLQGQFFPHIFPVDNENVAKAFPQGLTFRHFLDLVKPSRAVDVALVLLWSFMAGFAERLVPDALERIVGKGTGGSGDSDSLGAAGTRMGGWPPRAGNAGVETPPPPESAREEPDSTGGGVHSDAGAVKQPGTAIRNEPGESAERDPGTGSDAVEGTPAAVESEAGTEGGEGGKGKDTG